METAPILIFTYKRLEPLKLTIAALQKNAQSAQSDVYIFSDGPKGEKDVEQVDKVRAYIKTIGDFGSLTIKEAEKNKGLANSIIDGVTEILTFSDRVIVLEDDLLTTSNFLSFMNAALTKYEDSPTVFSISGYSLDLGTDESHDSEVYFLNRGWSWGWATWKDRWSQVDWQVKDYESFKRDKQKRKDFAKGGSDLNKMLREQMEKSLDSWAIRWFYHQYKIKGLTLYPLKSKVYNNGFDNLATHTNGSDKRYRPVLDTVESFDFNFPYMVSTQPYYSKKFLIKLGIKARAISKIQTIFLMIKKLV
jgi:hypothetical protein